MKFIRKLLEWAFILMIGFFIGLFFGPQIIEEISPVENVQPVSTSQEKVELKQPDKERPQLSDFFSRYPESVDETLVEERIFVLVNELRSELGLDRVEKNHVLEDAANIRAHEIEESFSHTRPNGQEPFSVLEEPGTEYSYQMVGENLAMATFIDDEEAMSTLIMEGWIDSEEHYQTMINPHYNEIGIGVHYDGEILYVTQFFGKQR